MARISTRALNKVRRITKNADEGVAAARRAESQLTRNINRLQNNVDSGMSVSDAVSDFLDQREKQNKRINKAINKRRSSGTQSTMRRNTHLRDRVSNDELADAIANGREAAQQRRNAMDYTESRKSRMQQKNAEAEEISKARKEVRNDAKAAKNEEFYTWADKNGYDIMDKDQLRQARIVKNRNDEIAAKRAAMKDYDDIYNKIGYNENFYSHTMGTKYSDRKVTEKNSIFAQEYGSDNVKATGYTVKDATDDALTNNAKYKEKVVIERGKKNRQPETSPSGGNASIMKQVQDKVKGNNFVYNMAAMGVGGGLVLNLANNKGQQSNAQLYGQY